MKVRDIMTTGVECAAPAAGNPVAPAGKASQNEECRSQKWVPTSAIFVLTSSMFLSYQARRMCPHR